MFLLINDKSTDSRHFVRYKLVIPRLPRTIWSIFSSFLIFCYYFTHVKAREINQQNMEGSENINQIGSVR